ncbi:TPA: BrnT family toxin [Legionella anisa]
MSKNKTFTWDEPKRQINIEKHGIDFLDAKHIFEDPYRIVRESHRNDEDRYEVIGEVNSNVLLVVYVIREGNVYRLISARRASRNERKSYYEI